MSVIPLSQQNDDPDAPYVVVAMANMSGAGPHTFQYQPGLGHILVLQYRGGSGPITGVTVKGADADKGYFRNYGFEDLSEGVEVIPLALDQFVFLEMDRFKRLWVGQIEVDTGGVTIRAGVFQPSAPRKA